MKKNITPQSKRYYFVLYMRLCLYCRHKAIDISYFNVLVCLNKKKGGLVINSNMSSALLD